MRMVATEVIEEGEEVFVEYGTGYRWEEATEEREGWEYVRRKGGREGGTAVGGWAVAWCIHLHPAIVGFAQSCRFAMVLQKNNTTIRGICSSYYV